MASADVNTACRYFRLCYSTILIVMTAGARGMPYAGASGWVSVLECRGLEWVMPLNSERESKSKGEGERVYHIAIYRSLYCLERGNMM